MKKIIKILSQVIMLALTISSSLFAMRKIEDKTETKAAPLARLNRTHIARMPGAGHFRHDIEDQYDRRDLNREFKRAWGEPRGLPIGSRGFARGGNQVVKIAYVGPAPTTVINLVPMIGKTIPSYCVLSVPSAYLERYRTVLYQPGQPAYPLTDPADIHHNSIIHIVLRVLLESQYKLENITELEEKHAGLVVEAHEETEKAMSTLLATPEAMTEVKTGVYAEQKLIDAQNKMGIRPTHMCIAWLNTDELRTLVDAGASIHVDNGLQRNLLHFLVIFLTEPEFQGIFCRITPENFEYISGKVKRMVQTLIYNHRIEESREVIDTLRHPGYMAGKTGKELELLQALPWYMQEPVYEKVLPALKGLVTDRTPVPVTEEPEPGAGAGVENPGKHATEDPTTKVHENLCKLISEYTIG